MATIDHSGDWITGGVFRYTVTGMGGADVSTPIDAGNFEERVVQVDGTFATCTVTIQGRLATDLSWETMTTPTGGDVSFTAAGVLEIEEPAYQYRVSNTTPTTGTASDADLSVAFLMRGE